MSPVHCTTRHDVSFFAWALALPIVNTTIMVERTELRRMGTKYNIVYTKTCVFALTYITPSFLL